MPSRRLRRKELRMAASLLLSRHREPVARAVAKQIRATVPRYRSTDLDAVSRNTAAFLKGIERLLVDGSEHAIMDAARGIAELRMAAGFEAGEFMVAGLCFLPVLRRFFMKSVRSLEHALEMYEAVESVLIPFVNRGTSILLEAGRFERPDGGFDIDSFAEMFSDGELPMLPLDEISEELNPEKWARQEAVTQPGIRIPRDLMDDPGPSLD